jgi:hypothetical protein
MLFLGDLFVIFSIIICHLYPKYKLILVVFTVSKDLNILSTSFLSSSRKNFNSGVSTYSRLNSLFCLLSI